MNPQSLQFLGAVRRLESQGYSRDEAYQMVTKGMGTNTPSTSTGLFDDINVDPISMGTPNQMNPNTSGFDMTGGMNPVGGNPTGVDWSTPINGNMPQAPQGTMPEITMNTNQGVGGARKNLSDFKTEDEYVKYLVEERGMAPQDAREAWRERGNYNPENDSQQGKYTPEQLEYMKKMQELQGKQSMWGSLSAQGTDPMTALFLAGNAAGMQKGAKGRGLTIAAGVGKGILGGVGSFMEGLANSKTTQYSQDWYRKQQYGPDANLYTAAPQTRNTNNTGGTAFKFGGLFEDGGEQEEMPETPMEAGVEEGVEQVQEPQEEQQGMMQQVAAQVAQALNQGTSPQMIIQSLVKKGMSEQQATQLVSMVVQKMQEENQSADQETEDSGEVPEMRQGGKFKHKVGEYIKFEYGGKMKEGKIKKIENGKIYL